MEAGAPGARAAGAAICLMGTTISCLSKCKWKVDLVEKHLEGWMTQSWLVNWDGEPEVCGSR